ncbi:MAG: phosphoribosylanthranilate isomerase [Gammaproteobacteria bacterium]|uniref:N-(5'-phosphoribosyl)anthranilate isomerase n=1 Tax=Candidatus Thiopontia autotrophica TaxID=2841688 RepID=A0A8J6PBR6_9GAMM|nr:phosphoribosylanthranilate isomerase [Candidatus Thiopontia autotrophica]MBL6969153.1 phosphoribosylanthranilate isomerase [Gammaproteobacteria bacterium]
MQTRLKICGITSKEDAIYAAESGADAIGLVFYEPSPRAVTVEQAAEIIGALPPFVTTVGLFVDAEAGFVNEVLSKVSLDLLQFHGDESPAYCDSFSRPYMKAIRMREDVDLQQEAARYATARALLVDAYQPGVPGGTGETFDWERIPSGMDKPLVLAGGLNADNVESAIRQVRPWAVDVSGGVEREKGVKDHLKVYRFIDNVRRVKD